MWFLLSCVEVGLDPRDLSLLVAFSAGVLSFLSPCVLPLVPAYVGHLAGSSAAAASRLQRWAALVNSMAFVAGFSLVFVGFWASVGLVGYVLPGHSGLLRQMGGAVLIVLGLHELGILRIPFLYQQFRVEPRIASAATPATSLLVGVAFAAGWTPCVGPVLAGIIGLASMSETVARGSLLLVSYSLGLGLPFIAMGLAAGYVGTLLNRVKRWLRLVSMLSGVLLLAIGLMMLSDTLKLLPQYFSFGWIGT